MQSIVMLNIYKIQYGLEHCKSVGLTALSSDQLSQNYNIFTVQLCCSIPKNVQKFRSLFEAENEKIWLTWHLLEESDRLVHSLEGFIDVLLHLLRVDSIQRIVHPALVPPQPIRNRDPQVSEWLKFLHKFGQLFIL